MTALATAIAATAAPLFATATIIVAAAACKIHIPYEKNVLLPIIRQISWLS
jgi:hypothetical protein